MNRREAEPVLLIGAGRFVREVIPLLREQGREIVGILDDRGDLVGSRCGGVPVLGPVRDVVAYPDADVLVTVAWSRTRRDVVARLIGAGVAPERFTHVIDPTFRNPDGSRFGPGSIVFAGVTVTADAVIGAHVVAMPGVTITHDCRVADFVTFAAGVALGGGVHIGEAAYLGMNAAVRQEVHVGEDAVIGMGAMVLHDVPVGQTWAGVPAVVLGGTPELTAVGEAGGRG